MSKKKKKIDKSLKKTLILSGGILLSIPILYLGIISAVYAQKVYPNVKIGAISAGGKTKEQLAKIISEKVADYQDNFDFSSGSLSWEMSSQEAFQYNISQTVDRAYNVGRDNSLLQSLSQKLRIIFVPEKIDPELIFNIAFNDLCQQITEKVDQSFRNADLEIVDGEVEVIPESEGRELKIEQLKSIMQKRAGEFTGGEINLPVGFSYPTITRPQAEKAKNKTEEYIAKSIVLKFPNNIQRISTKQISEWIVFSTQKDTIELAIARYMPIELKNDGIEVKLDQDKIKKYVIGLASKVDQPAKNAVLVFTTSLQIKTPETIGRKLDQGLLINDINTVLGLNEKREVTLKIDIIQPTIRRDNINTLGIKEMISQGISSFGGSPANRIHNIRVGSAKFDSILIEPDQKVSFNKILGKVSAATGYLPELVIKDNQTIPEFGGGLCQVSTTFFRAALLSGVPILEREPHAYRVKYYDWPYGPGVDATVYLPHPDVRFRNDTGAWILIQTEIKGNKLYFNFYGTKGGRSVTLEGPFTLESNPDGSMKTVFYRHILENGVEKRKDTFASSYDSPAKYPHPTPEAPETAPQEAQPPPTG